MTLERWLPWAVRVTWAVLPLTAGGALGDAVHEWNPSSRTAASGLLWVGWALIALATVVPLPVGLTALRTGAASAVVVCATALAPGAVVAPIVLALALRPEIAEWYVNGPAYPSERRFPLRVPSAVLLGPLWLAGAATVATPAAAVLVLADGQWVLGTVLALVGLAAALLGGRALHGLSRRWVVFVPAGVVLHDPLSLADPVLFPRNVIESLQAAPADSDSLDLTQGALGLALELVLHDKVPMVRRVGGHDEPGASARLLFTPTRPGRVLAEAGRRRVPAG